MVLLKGERAQAALASANEALEHAEGIAIRLNTSLSLLRSSRDALAEKMRCDTAAVFNRPDASRATAPAPPVVRRWSF
jgi:hypothetical protein